MFPVNIKKMDDIKQAMKYIDNGRNFWTSVLAWEAMSKEDQEE
jgi:hypothetical protein